MTINKCMIENVLKYLFKRPYRYKHFKRVFEVYSESQSLREEKTY